MGRVVVVPPVFVQTLTSANSHVLPVKDQGRVITSLHVDVPPINTPLLIDPLDAYWRAYAPWRRREQHRELTWVAHESEMRRRVWEPAAIHDWIEAHARRTVLVQPPGTGGDCWRFAFTDPDDKSDFAAWLPREREHPVLVEREVAERALEWAKANLRGDFDVDTLTPPGAPPAHSRFFVRDPDEAVHFKLRWAGSVNA